MINVQYSWTSRGCVSLFFNVYYNQAVVSKRKIAEASRQSKLTGDIICLRVIILNWPEKSEQLDMKIIQKDTPSIYFLRNLLTF